jgi:hypothetical protein
LSVFPHLFRMTTYYKGYDANDAFAREHEFHFTTSRRGSPSTIRRTLARRGVRYFQHSIYRRYHRWIPLHKIRVSFETEEQAKAVDRAIQVYIREIRYHGKQYMASKLPPTEIPYAKKSRRSRTGKRKRAKAR